MLIVAFGAPIGFLSKEIKKEKGMAFNLKSIETDKIALVGFTHLRSLASDEDLNQIYHIVIFNDANLEAEKIHLYLNKPADLSPAEIQFASYIEETTKFGLSDTHVIQLVTEHAVPKIKNVRENAQ